MGIGVLNVTEGKLARLLASVYRGSGVNVQQSRRDVRWIMRRIRAEGVSLGVRAYTAAIATAGRGSPEGALEMWNEMIAARVAPDAHSYDALLAGVASDETTFNATVAAKRRAGFPPSKYEAAATLKMLAKKKEMGSQQSHVYSAARAALDAVAVPDHLQYAKLVCCCSSVREVDEVLKIMEKKGVIPESRVLFEALSVAAEVKDATAAVRYYKMLDRVGVVPQTWHHTALSRAHRAAGDLTSAAAIWRRLPDALDDASVVERLSCLPPLPEAERVFSALARPSSEACFAFLSLLRSTSPHDAKQRAQRLNTLRLHHKVPMHPEWEAVMADIEQRQLRKGRQEAFRVRAHGGSLRVLPRKRKEIEWTSAAEWEEQQPQQRMPTTTTPPPPRPPPPPPPADDALVAALGRYLTPAPPSSG